MFTSAGLSLSVSQSLPDQGVFFELGLSGAPEFLEVTCHRWGLTEGMQTEYSEAAGMHHNGAQRCCDLAGSMHAWQTTYLPVGPVGPMPTEWTPTSSSGAL